MPDNTPVPAPASDGRADNPFRAVAILLDGVRVALENSKRQEQAPRWVRIVRVREFRDDTIAKGVMKALDVLTLAVAYLQRFTLDANDLLIQGDAAKALVEVSAEFIKTATSKEFINSLELAVGQDPSPDSPIPDVANIIDKIVQIADKVPEPDDLKVIGASLYKLLGIEQAPLDEVKLGAATESHVVLAHTGTLRLLQFGFDQNFKLQNFGKGASVSSLDINRLGARRLWEASADKLPLKSLGKFGEAPDVETVWELDFSTDKSGSDVQDANAILEALGYTTPNVADRKLFSPEFAGRLRSFQQLNELPVTGKLDNATLNRLLHLDYDAKNLKRAKRFKADALPKGFDPLKAPA
ncbi:peptidoglycan-binding domain-containing protein [Zoogloea sp. LCSB751]|uniref:peptidoglycan-binding domain-containing protein n=1 Tax=Zoogloea sp. LCSB751 TaxID=1965277 RepID=UPI0011177A34|nr:peptidoglycan-binding domain-containing protein [Zoogloea sp. LCSB751]